MDAHAYNDEYKFNERWGRGRRVGQFVEIVAFLGFKFWNKARDYVQVTHCLFEFIYSSNGWVLGIDLCQEVSSDRFDKFGFRKENWPDLSGRLTIFRYSSIKFIKCLRQISRLLYTFAEPVEDFRTRWSWSLTRRFFTWVCSNFNLFVHPL